MMGHKTQTCLALGVWVGLLISPFFSPTPVSAVALVSEENFPGVGEIKFERNLLVFEKIPFRKAKFEAKGLDKEFKQDQKDKQKHLEDKAFADITKKRILESMSSKPCSLYFANSRFFRNVLVHRIWKIFEKKYFDAHAFRYELKRLGKQGAKWQRTNFENTDKSRSLLLNKKIVKESLDRMGDIIVESIRNRLKKGVLKSVKFSFNKLTDTVTKNFESMCTRSHLIERALTLRSTDYFLNSLQTRLKDEQLNETKTKEEHLNHLKEEVDGWHKLGALTKQQVFRLKDSLDELLRRVHASELQKIEMNNGLTLSEIDKKVEEKKKEKESLGAMIDELNGELQDETFSYDDEKMFLNFIKSMKGDKDYMTNFERFHDRLISFLRVFRSGDETSADQTNRLVDSSRKVYLEKMINAKKFNLGRMLSGVLEDIRQRKHMHLNWSFFGNLVNKTMKMIKKREQSGSGESKMDEIKDIFNQLYQKINEAIAMNILPKKFASFHFESLKKETLEDLKWRILRTKDLSKIKDIQVEEEVEKKARHLRKMDKQVKSYTHVYLTNLLDVKNALNPRYLKRCKRMFSKQRSMAMFRKDGFYLIIIKMFFEAHRDISFKNGDEQGFRHMFMEYLKTLEYFRYISIEQRRMIMTHVLYLITPYIDRSSGKFRLDDFYAMYNMILKREEPVDYSGEKEYKDWPDKLMIRIGRNFKRPLYTRQFEQLKTMIVKYKDSLYEPKKADIMAFLFKHNLLHKRKMEMFVMHQLQMVMKKIKDMQLHPKQQEYAKVLTKMMIAILFPKSTHSINQNRAILRKIVDKLIEVKGPPAAKFLFKKMIRIADIVAHAFKTKMQLDLFAVKVSDQLIIPNIPAIKFLFKNSILTKRFYNVYMGIKTAAILKVIKDMEIKPEVQLKFLIKFLYKIMFQIMSNQKVQVEASLKKIFDQLVITETPYSKFLIKTIIRFQALTQMGDFQKSELEIFQRKFVDNFIKVEPVPLKYLFKKNILSKKFAADYMKGQMSYVGKKIQDMFREIEIDEKIIIHYLQKTKPNFIFHSKLQYSTFIKKLQDYFNEVKSPLIKFMMKSLIRIPSKAFAAKRVVTLGLILKKFKDNMINVQGQVKFIIRDLIRVLGKAKSSFAKFNIKAELSRVQDHYNAVDPGVIKIFIASMSRIKKVNEDAGMKLKISLVNKMFVDNMIHVEPGLAKFLVKGLVVSKKKIQAMAKGEVKAFLEKYKDNFVKIDDLQKFLMGSLLRIVNRFTFSSSAKLRFFLRKFKDMFVQPASSAIKFLIKALISAGKRTDYAAKKTYLKVFIRQMRDNLIQVVPGFPKFLLKSKLGLKHKNLVKKLFRFTAFFKKYQDFLVSPLSWDKFLLTTLMFSNYGSAQLKRLAKLKMLSKKVRDFFIYVQPGVNKFLLTCFLHFMKNVQFKSITKVKFLLKKFVDALNVPIVHQKFLLQSFLRLFKRFSASRKMKLSLNYQKFLDNFIAVDIPGKFLVKSMFTKKQSETFKRVMKLKAFWKKYRDFLLTPMTWNKFLLFSSLFGKLNYSALTTQQLKTFLVRMKDLHVVVEGNFPKFIIHSLYKFLNEMSFFSSAKLRFVLTKFVDNLIVPQAAKKFLLQCFIQILKKFSVSTKTSLKVNYKKLYDYYIAISPPGKFLVSSELAQKNSIFKKSLEDLRGFWIKMQDFLVSPLTPGKFLLTSVLLGKNSLTSASDKKKLSAFFTKFKDFYNLVQPPFVKFLLSTIIQMSSKFNFSSKTKLRYFLKHLVDQYIVTSTEKKFLISVLTSLLSPAFTAHSKLIFRTMYMRYLDNYIQIPAPEFLLKSKLETKLQQTMKNLLAFQTKFTKLRDFFISPFSMDKYLIMAVLMNSTSPFAKKVLKINYFAEKMKDYFILAQPGFMKFLLQSLMTVGANIHFHSVSKLRFFLQKFVDQFVQPHIPGKFLVKALLQILTPIFAINQKMDFHLALKKYMDYMIDVQIPGKFLITANLYQSTDIFARKVLDMKAFWEKFQDFLNTAEPVNKFLLTSLVMTSTQDNAYRKEIARMFNIRLRDYHNIVQPGFVKFLVTALISLLNEVSFSSKTKLRFFMKKFVDAFIVPDIEKKFLIKALLQLVMPGFNAFGKIEFKGFFKKFVDEYIPVVVPGKFLIQAGMHGISDATAHKVQQMMFSLRKMKDFFISPMRLDKFIIFSLLFNSHDPNMRQVLDLHTFNKIVRDYHVLVELPFKKFLVSALYNFFTGIRFCSKAKLHFVLTKFIDALNVPEIPGKFLIKAFYQLMVPSFNAYQKYEFGGQFKKLLDFYIEPYIPGKFVVKSEQTVMTEDMVHRVEDFHTFLTKLQDFLIIPTLSNKFLLFSLIAFKGVDPYAQAYARYFGEFKNMRDFLILAQPGFVKFLLQATLMVSKDIHFRSLNKVHFFLTKLVDQFITVEGPKKFLIKYLFQLVSSGFTANSKIDLHMFLQKYTDYKIDPHVPGKFLLTADLFGKMMNIYATKIARLHIFFTKLQDFFIQPVTFEKFLLKSFLELKLNDLSFVKTLDAKTYFKVFQDYHNIVEPNVVLFIVRALMNVSKDITMHSKTDLKLYLTRFADMFIQVSPGIKFLVTALLDFFVSNFQVSKTKISIMCQKYIDNFIEVQPQMKFLILATSTLDQEINSVKKLHLKFVMQKVRDQHNEVKRLDKFIIKSYLEKHGIDQSTFNTKMSLFAQKMRDYFIAINVQKFLVKSLLTGNYQMSASKKTEMNTFFMKLKDEYNEATPFMVMFLLKGLMVFFADMNFKSETQLRFFLQKYVDQFYDVLAKNTANMLGNLLKENCSLVANHMNFNSLFKKLKMAWLFRNIRNVNMLQEHSVYDQFLQYFHLGNETSFAKTKMGYLWRAIRGVNMNNVIDDTKAFSDEMMRSFDSRMFNLRMNFIRKGFGFNMTNQEQMKADLPTILKRYTDTTFFRKKTKIFFRLKTQHIEQETHRHEFHQKNDISLDTIMGKTRIKMFDQPGIANRNKGFSALDQHASIIHDMMSKTIMKTLRPDQEMLNSHDNYINLFKKKKQTLDSLDKIYLKTLNVQQGTALQSDYKALTDISKSLSSMQTELKKTMLKELSFEDRPIGPKLENMNMKTTMVSQGLREMDNKLRGVGKLLLNMYKPGAKSKRIKMMVSQSPIIIQDIKNHEHFNGFKKLVLRKIEPKVLAKSHMLKALTTQVNAWLEHTQDYDPTEFMKVLLLSVAKPGNKVTDVDPVTFMGSFKKDIVDILKRKEALFEPTSKALLLSVAKPGNKETDKEVLLKNMLGELIQQNMLKKRKITPEEFSKILIKHFGFPRVYHPLFKKAVLNKVEKVYPVLREHMLNKPEPQAKVILLSTLGPGNKITDLLPKEYKMKSLRQAQQAYHNLKMTLTTAKKIYLKGQCKCCCEYYIIYNFEECQYYEDTAEDYIIDKAMHEIEEKGGKLTDYEMFDAIVDQIEHQDFECESGPKHMIYNILPDVKITLGVKRYPGSMVIEPQELTETKDVKKIVGAPNPMYDIDTDFIDKMVANDMAMDPKNIKKPRKNNYFDSPEYQNSSHLIDFLDSVYDEGDVLDGRVKDPLADTGDLMGKDFHEEHEQTRNGRLGQYSLDAEKVPSNVAYERLLREKEGKRQKIQLDDVHLLDRKDVLEMEDTVDKL